MRSERCFFALTPTRAWDLAASTQKTALELARLLVPPSVEVQNATYTGTNVARGKFANGNACGLPIDSGVILSSGPISAAPGPNNDTLGHHLPCGVSLAMAQSKAARSAPVWPPEMICGKTVTDACFMQASDVTTDQRNDLGGHSKI